MAVDTKHPSYDEFAPDWDTMNNTNCGERTIKDADEAYLPSTGGMRQDGMATGQPGREDYDAYKMRARFPDIVSVAVEALVGVMHAKEPVIELPKQMENLLTSATLSGESLPALLRRINEQQLLNGRVGLLLDIEDNGKLPYIAMYGANKILNWDNGSRNELVQQNLNLVVLDESDNIRQDDLSWKHVRSFRVAVLGRTEINEGKDEGAVYRVGEFTEENGLAFNDESLKTPSIAGRTLKEIPFVFVNATDIIPAPEAPPLLGLANLAISIYRADADYRQALFLQGQDTLVVMGGMEDQVFRTGAGAAIILPEQGDAKFIGVDSMGLSEMRSSLENDKLEASQRSGQLLDSVSREKESGDALRVRVVARTATLRQAAKTGAFGLEMLLKQAARWLGADESQVSVKPNMDFVDDVLQGKTLIEYATAKSLGIPLSNESIHRLMKMKGITEMEFTEELAKIESEKPLGLGDLGNDPGADD